MNKIKILNIAIQIMEGCKIGAKLVTILFSWIALTAISYMYLDALLAEKIAFGGLIFILSRFSEKILKLIRERIIRKNEERRNAY